MSDCLACGRLIVVPYGICFCLFLYVILSGEKRLRFAESKFHRAKGEVKSRRQSAAGIWLKISVAYQRNVTSIQKATQTPSHIPSSHSLLGFVSDRRRERLTPSTKLRLRALRSAQNDRLIAYFIKCQKILAIGQSIFLEIRVSVTP